MADQQQTLPVEENNQSKSLPELDRQASILDTITDGGFRLNEQGRILNATTAAQHKIFRRSLEDLKGKILWKEFPQFAGSLFESQVQKSLSSQHPDHFEVRLPRMGIWYDVYTFPEAGQVDIYLKDITYRKRFEQSAHGRETLLKAIFETDPSGLAVITGKDLHVVYVNQAFRDFLPYPELDLVGKPVLDLIPNEIQGLNIDFLVQYLQENERIFVPQICDDRLPGGPRYFAVHLQNLNWEEEPAILIVIWETTEREQLLRELEAERSLWKTTVGSMIDAVTICDSEGKAYYMNEAYTCLVQKSIVPGLAKEDHSQVYQLYHPDGTIYEPSDLPLQKAALTGQPQHAVELVQKTANGEDMLLTWNASPIRDEHDKVIGAVAVGHDITFQRQMETALRQSEEKFRLIADSMPNIVWTADKDGTVDYINRFGMELFGLSEAHVDLDVVSAHFSQEDWQEVIRVWQGAIEQGGTVELEHRLIQANGDSCWFLSRAIPVRNARQEIIKWYGTATNIQALKTAQVELEQRVEARTQELRIANEELRLSAGRSLILSEISRQMSEAGVDYQRVVQTVVRSTSMLIGDACILLMLSDDGKLLNPVAFFHRDVEALARMAEVLRPDTQHPDEGMQGEVFSTGKGRIVNLTNQEDWLAITEKEYRFFDREIESSSTMIVPLRMKDKVVGTLSVTRDRPGKTYTLEDQILLQELADRAAMAIFNSMLYRDLEKSLLQEKLMRQQLIQSEKYAALARLVASVAHELNNPIQTIQNCVYLIRSEIPAGSMQDYMNMAIDETRRIAGLTKQLRETYRPAKDTTFTSFNLVEVVKSVYSLLEPHFHHNQVSWEMLPSPASVMVHGIPDQLKQVFINICINAIDAIGEGSGRLEVEIALYPDRERVCVRFHDSGSGISPEDLDKLFEPFFTTKPKGTGLGLAISREIVEGHGGEITADSTPGQGAVFEVWLPVLESRE